MGSGDEAVVDERIGALEDGGLDGREEGWNARSPEGVEERLMGESQTSGESEKPTKSEESEASVGCITG